MPTWYSALVWFVPCVSSDVLLEVRQLGELPLADLAPVGLDAEVDSRVLGEVRAVGERLIARSTLVGLGFPHVNLGVELEVSFASEDLKKERTSKLYVPTLLNKIC